MAYIVTKGPAGVQPIATKDTTKNHPYGKIVTAVDPTYGEGEFIYLKGVASCALGSWVTYNMDDGTTTLAGANAIGPVAVAMTSTTASYYGWFQISGKAVGKCLTQFADNGAVFLTSTDGSIDDASVAGDLVQLAKGASATTANTFVADFEISRPFVNDRTANK